MVRIVGRDVGTTGFGLMGLTNPGFNNSSNSKDEQAITIMKAALNAGANFWNGGEFYGPPERNSLQLLHKYFTKYPEDADKVVLSIKGGMKVGTYEPVGDEQGVRRSVDNCLTLLGGKKKLDLFECGRVDPNTPIEETMQVLETYVKDGKLGGISLSEVSAKTIRRAAKVTKIECVEIEFSMFATEALENGVAETCRELGIPIIAYSPLGRGFLAGQLKTLNDLPANDSRRRFPRFQPGNFEKNLELVQEVERVAKTKECTPGQVALAWIKAHSGAQGLPDVLPIPGTTQEARLAENMKKVELDSSELQELDDIVKNASVAGTRYPEMFEKMNYG